MINSKNAHISGYLVNYLIDLPWNKIFFSYTMNSDNKCSCGMEESVSMGTRESHLDLNLLPRRPRDSDDQTWEEYDQEKNRWSHVSTCSLQNTQLLLAPTFHFTNLSHVARRLWIVILKENLDVKLGNHTSLYQSKIRFTCRIKCQGSCEENLQVNESFFLLQRSRSLPVGNLFLLHGKRKKVCKLLLLELGTSQSMRGS